MALYIQDKLFKALAVTAGTIITALGGSAAISYSITAAGTGYAIGDIITVVGGIYTVNKQLIQ